MDCRDVRLHLLDYQQGRLGPELDGQIRLHLDGCPACTHEETAERALTQLLDHRLPQYPASLGLKRRLAMEWPSRPPAARHSWWSRWGRAWVPAFAVAAVLLVAIPLYYERAILGQATGPRGLAGEAVNDHLRIVSGERPLGIQSGGIHQVKPWFTGRLDFAPVVPFEGSQEFPLQGGTVEYFLDRKAAAFVYHRRLHAISLFVFRAEGLPWPTRGLEPMGTAHAYRTTLRGFNVVLWRTGELGYALVSDVDSSELVELGAKVSGSS